MALSYEHVLCTERTDVHIRIGPWMLCKLSYGPFYFERRRLKIKCKYMSRGGFIYKSTNSIVTDYCFDSNIPPKKIPNYCP